MKNHIFLLSGNVVQPLTQHDKYLAGKIDLLGTPMRNVREALESIVLTYMQTRSNSSKHANFLNYDVHLYDGNYQFVNLYIKNEYFETELFENFESGKNEFLLGLSTFIASANNFHNLNTKNGVGQSRKNLSVSGAVVSAANCISKLSDSLKDKIIIQTSDQAKINVKYIPNIRTFVEETYSFEGELIGIVDKLENSKNLATIIVDGERRKFEMNFKHACRGTLSVLWNNQELAQFKVCGDSISSNPTARCCSTLELVSIELKQSMFW